KKNVETAQYAALFSALLRCTLEGPRGAVCGLGFSLSLCLCVCVCAVYTSRGAQVTGWVTARGGVCRLLVLFASFFSFLVFAFVPGLSLSLCLSVRVCRIATTIIVSKADNFYISNMKYASVDDFLEKCALKRDPHQPE
ncbi:hypothetical protein DQ04_26471000, partial [Trypanosoma grayi]|uniref:hypothetical protein n=1 Tax=Trypanosoma grayi TaxID=71804 RepID=UPI0004F47E26